MKRFCVWWLCCRKAAEGSYEAEGECLSRCDLSAVLAQAGADREEDIPFFSGWALDAARPETGRARQSGKQLAGRPEIEPVSKGNISRYVERCGVKVSGVALAALRTRHDGKPRRIIHEIIGRRPRNRDVGKGRITPDKRLD